MQESVQDKFRNAGLVRAANGRIVGGVIAGLARHYGLTPWRARLVFILGLMVIPGSQLPIYVILWLLMPDERVGDGMHSRQDEDADRTLPADAP
jgi:phage shock protein C